MAMLVVGSVGKYTIPIDPSSDWRLANPQNPTKLATVPTKARGRTRSSQGVDSRGDLEKKGQQQRLCGRWVSSRKTNISCLTLQH